MAISLWNRLLWRVTRAAGLEQTSWDLQYKSGVLTRGRSPIFVSRTEELLHGGRLFEFGCGEGDLPHLLNRNSFSDYFGYDISKIAIERAKSKAQSKGLADVNFECCSMEEWPGSHSIQLIAIDECIYYLTIKNLEEFLKRCCDSLAPDGRILIAVHDGAKHVKTTEACKRFCKVFDERVTETGTEASGRYYLVLGSKSDRV